jgi:hypothetical protein
MGRLNLKDTPGVDSRQLLRSTLMRMWHLATRLPAEETGAAARRLCAVILIPNRNGNWDENLKIERKKRICRLAGWVLGAGCLVAFAAGSSSAQETSGLRRDLPNSDLQSKTPSKPDSPSAVDGSLSGQQAGAQTEPTHRFWDKENDWLFAGVGASRTFDYFSTLNMRQRGRQEILLTNDVVDNHAAFAVIEASATGVSIGAAYLFHHYGHHKLERWTSIVHIGAATTGAVRNYCLKTAHLK